MKKQDIISHYESFSVWLESIKDLDRENWLKPVSAGKWPVAAVVAHLLFWDRYSIEQRFPFFKEGAVLENFPDFQSVNNAALEYAKKHAQLEIIEELLSVRRQFLQMLEGMSEEKLDTAFKIGSTSLTVRDYFADFIGHDIHHKKQIIQSAGISV
ncbi:putative damage-inducible protein DinB [Cytobacillus firmus]|uniref:Putative damage-inducible protein DinB n=2 Tax=Cytobacillus TaxID=2675230 RepID=A0A366K046_CYTFI|nr:MULTISPECIES: DinB family protein [Cytobacillus]RBP95030.1 putative damage-inducible protein DinB [Cytobacillus firmus]TDX43871.1 putative damage-inducible protein DinB [Cytobacillus oceanisediminis]